MTKVLSLGAFVKEKRPSLAELIAEEIKRVKDELSAAEDAKFKALQEVDELEEALDELLAVAARYH
jgi:hypothetical protein